MLNRLIRKSILGDSLRARTPWRSFCGHADFAKSASANGSDEKQPVMTDGGRFDVAIVGGGMVGLALACSLASMPMTRHLSIAIIDGNPALVNGICVDKVKPPDPRVSTVTPATISMFKDMGAWEYVLQHRHAYFDRMQVWDYTGLGYTRYSARDVNKEVLGCVVENKVLQSSLLFCSPNADLSRTIFPSRLASMSLNQHCTTTGVNDFSFGTSSGDFAKLQLSDGTYLSTKLVVGADGSKSRVRELAGFKTTGWNYLQNAVICTVEHDAENWCAWQRFLPSGPIALLPIGDNYSNIVWTMNPSESMSRQSMDEADFIKEVNHALNQGYGPHPTSGFPGSDNGIFSWLKTVSTPSANEKFELPLKVVKLASERMAFPLSLKHANNYVSKHIALVGDAAHTVHPLAGQGVNLGFGDALALSRVIGEAIAVGIDIGEVSMLRKYEAKRKVANLSMMAVLEGVQKLYKVDLGPLNALRATAFHAANYIPLLKRNIISFASGEQQLPPLFT